MTWDELHEALYAAADAKSEADRLDKLRRRVRYQCYLAADGPVVTREATAGTHPAYVEAEEAALAASTEYNKALAIVESLRLRFDAWRTESALEREKISRGIYGEGK